MTIQPFAYSRLSPRSEQKLARRVLDSYLEFVNSEKLSTEGVQIVRADIPNSGRILFSLNDLPLHVRCARSYLFIAILDVIILGSRSMS